jgi:hypothetical protein
MAKRNAIRRRHSRKNMRGGYDEDQKNELRRNLADDQIGTLENRNIPYDAVMQAIAGVNLRHPDNNADAIAEEVMIRLVPTHENPIGIDDSFETQEQDTLLDKFDPDDITTQEESTQKEKGGSKKRRRISRKNRKSSRKNRKTRKNRRKQRGGTCYGNGVGANSSNPNYSIYNTNMLKLFPYRTN